MGKCNPITKIIPATCAWILLLASTGLFFAYPCRYLMFKYSIAIPIAQAIITYFVIVNFALATFVNPGAIPRAESDERIDNTPPPQLYQDIEIKGVRVRLKWCVTCQFYRPPRCVHCGVCDTCIETFDHHCPWVNNCIGRRNYRYFFMFLLWLSVHMVVILGLCVIYVKDNFTKVKDVETIITIAIIAVIIVLFIPILGLTAYHMVLIVQGRTTNEQVTGKFLDVKSPYSKGCCQNILRSLCSSPLPRFYTKTNLYTELNKHTQSVKATSARGSLSSLSKSSFEKPPVGSMTDPMDYMFPKQSQSQDSEASPPSYLNRGRLHLSLSESIYVRNQDSATRKGSRALTPPVPIRFDCSRRSLPPHNRFHTMSPHYPLPQSSQIFHTSKDVIVCASQGSIQGHSLYAYQPPGLYRYDYETSPECEPPHYHHKYCKRKDHPQATTAKSDDFLYSNSADVGNNAKAAMMGDNCCLGNQTVDKLQEIANRTLIGNQCVDASVLEAFPKGCGHFHNSPSKARHDVCQLLTAQTPQPMYVHNSSCVDCQHSEHSRQSSVSTNELARTPGNRPLSFVRAMEMSEALDFDIENRPCDMQPQRYVASSITYANERSKICKSDHEISYEISV